MYIIKTNSFFNLMLRYADKKYYIFIDRVRNIIEKKNNKLLKIISLYI